VLCDQHVAFAESLAYVLAARGDDVVAIVGQVSEVAEIVAREQVDICLVDAAADPIQLDDLIARCQAPGGASIVLLATEVAPDANSRVLQAGVRAVAAKWQSLAEVLRLLDRVQAGEQILDTVASRRRSPIGQPRHRTEGQRLATFLSPRERHVVSALVRGEDTATLARSLGMSANTARSHVQSVLTKLGTHSRLAAVRVAVQTGMVDARTGEWLIDLVRAS
jgi:two-component system nitrate/nitrite response regulator NarL